MNKINDLLKNFSAKIGFSQPLKLDHQGRLSVLIDQSIHIDMEYVPEQDALHIYTVVGEVSPHFSAEFLASMLQANFLGHGTESTVLSIDASMNEVLLEKTLDTFSLTEDGMARVMEQLIEASAIWRTRLVQAAQAQPAAALHRPDESVLAPVPMWINRA